MDLDRVFSFEDWTIRYALLGSDTVLDSTRERPSRVVFVHGTPWSSVTFVPIVKALLAQGPYQVLLYDLPGYGQSQEYKGSLKSYPKGNREIQFEGDTSVKLQAFALAELLSHLGWTGRGGQSAPAVVAHDIAGTIALRCNLMHDCRFSSLLFMDTNTVLPWGDGFYKLARSDAHVFCKLPFNYHEAVVRAVIQSACYDPEKLRSGWEHLLAKPWLPAGKETSEAAQASLQQSFFRQIAQADDADVAEMLDKNLYTQVSCPVKILWGENDQWIPRHKMDQLAEVLKPCLKSFVTIPEAGHLIMVDQPERVTAETISWLAQHS